MRPVPDAVGEMIDLQRERVAVGELDLLDHFVVAGAAGDAKRLAAIGKGVADFEVGATEAHAHVFRLVRGVARRAERDRARRETQLEGDRVLDFREARVAGRVPDLCVNLYRLLAGVGSHAVEAVQADVR